MPNLIHKNEKGMVLPLGLMFLAIIAIMGTTAVIITTTDLKIGTNYKLSQQAFYAAEAGTDTGCSLLVAGCWFRPL
jgi:Tfp pilus assembly protein PilX